MGESQNIEYKESWRDEYLKWICGFANSQGGTLYVGIKDNGKICGVSDSKKLMEDLPNKIASTLGRDNGEARQQLSDSNELLSLLMSLISVSDEKQTYDRYISKASCHNQTFLFPITEFTMFALGQQNRNCREYLYRIFY